MYLLSIIVRKLGKSFITKGVSHYIIPKDIPKISIADPDNFAPDPDPDPA